MAAPRTQRFEGGGLVVLVTGDDHVVVADSDGNSVGESWCRHNGYSYAAARQLFEAMQGALRDDDRDAIAKLVRFPLRVNRRGTSREIRDAQELRRSFGWVFSQGVRTRILEANAIAVFCNHEGAMLGAGVLWAEAPRDGQRGVFVVNGE